MAFKSTVPFWGLLALAAAPAFAQSPSGESFPSSLDESGLRTWLAAQTDMPASAVVSIGSNSVIGLKQVIGDPAGPGRYQIQIRAEVVNQRTASQGGYLSWAAELAVDCVQRRTRALGITNYTSRNLKGESRVVGGPAADWVTPASGTQLYSLLSSVCDYNFRRPLDQQTASATPAQPARTTAVAAQTTSAAPAPTPAPTPRPAPAPVAVAQVRPAPAPPPVAPRPTPPTTMSIAAASPPPAPIATSRPQPVDIDDEPAATSPPPAPPPRAEPPRVQVAVAAPPAQVAQPSPATAAPTFAPPPPEPPAPPPAPRRPLSKAAVQVGASDSESEAKSLGAKARRNTPGGGGLSVTVARASVNGRTVYRALLHGFAAKGEANAACQAIKSRGQDCFVRDSF